MINSEPGVGGTGSPGIHTVVVRRASKSTLQVCATPQIDHLTSGEDGFDELKAREGPVTHRNRDGTIKLDYGRRLQPKEEIVEGYNLCPVGRCRIERLRMDRRDCGLESVGAEPTRRKHPP